MAASPKPRPYSTIATVGASNNLEIPEGFKAFMKEYHGVDVKD